MKWLIHSCNDNKVSIIPAYDIDFLKIEVWPFEKTTVRYSRRLIDYFDSAAAAAAAATELISKHIEQIEVFRFSIVTISRGDMVTQKIKPENWYSVQDAVLYTAGFGDILSASCRWCTDRTDH